MEFKTFANKEDCGMDEKGVGKFMKMMMVGGWTEGVNFHSDPQRLPKLLLRPVIVVPFLQSPPLEGMPPLCLVGTFLLKLNVEVIQLTSVG
jgi:hypothetical protein